MLAESSSPKARRKLLDGEPLSADSPAHRAVRVAPDVIHEPHGGGAQSPRVAKMTGVDVLGCVDELTDGTGGSVDAVMGAAVGPYRNSRTLDVP